jgi:N-acetylglucosaminyldiphosphoundecaprenol N-acetyl-beta-D-mannosaminyltransferase
MSDPRAIRVMGERVNPLTVAEWLEAVTRAVGERKRRIFVSQNMHGMYVIKRDRRMRDLHRTAHVVRIDGMPLVWLARAAGKDVRRDQRAGFMDLMHPLMGRAAELGWRVYVLAGRPGVAERAAEVLRDRHHGLSIATDDGYFEIGAGSAEARERIERLRAYEPGLVLVGLGMPRQEHFLALHADALPETALLTCGAAFDYVAGAVPMCPRWLSAVGLEWAFRLGAEPRRLAWRYLVEPLTLVPFALRDVVLRRHDESGGVDAPP